VKLVFLPSSRSGLAWFRTYYKTTFPAGYAKAVLRLLVAQELLEANPLIGHPSDLSEHRELQIRQTPFALIYRIRNRRIEVSHLWDQRQDPARLFDNDLS
jgi:plasmid stabilization system protein ParE